MIKKGIKKIYKLIPFKKHFFSGLKKIWRVPESVYKHLTFTGVFKVIIDKNQSFLLKHYGFQIENEIFWEGLKGHWEKQSITLWIELCKNAHTIIDVGANTGIYSLVAQAVNPKATIYAFEPVKTVYEKLEANNRLNNYSIQCFQAALSNRNGKMAIYKVNSDHTYEATLNKVFEGKVSDEKKMEVDVLTLKSFIGKNGIKHIDLMKIDVETHEPEVIEGFGEYLEEFKPAILIELITDYVVAGVIPFFENLDYMFFNIDENKGIRRVDSLSVSDSYNYLLCTGEKAKQLNLL
jgi:FkbM family methyltransferase